MPDKCEQCEKLARALQPFAHMILLMSYDTDNKVHNLPISMKWVREAQKALGLID